MTRRNVNGDVAQEVARLIGWHPVGRAFDAIEAGAEETTSEHIAVCEIPAPPFGEEQRAKYLEDQFRRWGLDGVVRDAEGNVLGLRRGCTHHPLVVLSAHLDTVFPEDVDLRVQRRDGRLFAPGIGDNACGLAALLALVRVFQQSDIRTRGTLAFLGTVGEEGEGDLRGVRHFFLNAGWRRKTDAFISFDGHGVERIVHRALGSRRYRITVSGPGGHSWGDFGIVNPIHPLARAITQLMKVPLSTRPRTSLNIGRISGGQSVNSIPQSASVDVDVRSTSLEEIEKLEAALRGAVENSVQEEIKRCAGTKTRLKLHIERMGDRPIGLTPQHAPVVRAAIEASRKLGINPHLDCASTDANIPMSLGIPAIAIGGGGNSGHPHTLDEWYDATDREVGLKRAFLIALALVGAQTG